MKGRTGFVSNSSSTAFILDARLPSVKKWVLGEGRFVNSPPRGCGRATCLAVGQDAIDYANFLNEDMRGWLEEDSELGMWILGWAKRLGIENVVFARESDEDMGGNLGDKFPAGRALAEMEYH